MKICLEKDLRFGKIGGILVTEAEALEWLGFERFLEVKSILVIIGYRGYRI